MKPTDAFLFCFAFGSVWTLATTLLGGLHVGHHAHHHGANMHHGTHPPSGTLGQWFACMITPGGLAVFLTWFGGIGYLLTRHTGLLFWADLSIAVVFGVFGAWLLATFLQFLHVREKPLDPADYQMVGVLGKVSSPIRPDGVGELIYLRDGARTPVCARSEDGSPILRGEEVVVVRFDRGIAYVRTWDAMLQEKR